MSDYFLFRCRNYSGAYCHGLMKHSSCQNMIGSYDCICTTGYEKINGVCQDINECDNIFQDPCSKIKPHSICENTDGSFNCQCQTGYYTSDDKQSCIDIDECQIEIAEISCPNPNSICLNNPGSFTCACQTGYMYQQDQNFQDLPSLNAAPR